MLAGRVGVASRWEARERFVALISLVQAENHCALRGLPAAMRRTMSSAILAICGAAWAT